MRIRTTQAAKQVGDVVVVKSASIGGMRQIRCVRCGQMAVPTRLPNGQMAYACTACGAKFSSRRM